MWHKVDDQLAIAGALTESDLDDLARRGYRTIIDLRCGGESTPGRLSSEEERSLAVETGIRYEQIPLGAHNMDATTATAVVRAIATAAPLILLHCASGRRAGFLAMMNMARTKRWTVERCLEQLSAMGIAVDDAPMLRDLLIEFVDRHRADAAPSRIEGHAL